MSKSDELRARRARLSDAQRELLRTRLSNEPATAQRTSIPRVARTAPLTTSDAQERLAFLHALNPASSAYHLAWRLDLRGPFDEGAFIAAIEAIVRRHEALRLRYAFVDGTLTASLANDAHAEVQREDLTALAAENREAHLQQRLQAVARAPYDLAHDSPLRVRLFRCGALHVVVALVVHHIAADGWSVALLLRELAERYGDALRGRPLDESPPSVDYIDYSTWQRGEESSLRNASELLYWQQVLRDVPRLDLPTDMPRGRHPNRAGALVRRPVAPATTAAITSIARHTGATSYHVVCSALCVLLAKYSKQEELAIGTPAASRSHRELERIVGCIANPVVVRVDLAGDPTFAELVARVQARSLEAFAHSNVPHERVAASVDGQRDVARNPLFDVMLAVNRELDLRVSLEGLTVDVETIGGTDAKFDLSWTLSSPQGAELLEVEYACELFDASTVQGMVEHLERIIAQAGADPTRRLSDFDLCTASDLAFIARWNDRGQALPTTLFPERFSATALAESGRIAAVCGADSIDYATLDAQSRRVASWLMAEGMGAGSVVGLHVHRSLSMLVAQLGVLRSGAAYVPLDPAFPADRLTYMVEDSGARFVLHDGPADDVDIAGAMAGASVRAAWSRHARVVSLDTVLGAPARAYAPPVLSSSDTAYVLYTSGSTGRPKGVCVGHGALANLLATIEGTPGLARDDVVLSSTTLSFDISVCELLLPLCVGARLVIVPSSSQADAAAIVELQRAHDATVMPATPTTYRMLASANLTAPSMRAWICGEALPLDLAEDLLGRLGEVWNLYGPTETTIYASAIRLAAGLPFVPIGTPIANTSFYVVDERGRLCPPGVPGELFIGGVQVAHGYHARPGLTSTRFVPDPWSATPGARMYRTGDVVRLRRDGQLEFRGRADFQVKLRGYRIELGEIESVLSSCADVSSSAVALRDDAPGGSALVAYVVRTGGSRVDASSLREQLAQRLPAYMVPSFVQFLDELPLTPNRKVDRKRLPAVHVDEAAGSDAHEDAPQGAQELVVAEVFGDVLGRAHVSRHASFFSLGGHSLLVVRVVDGLRRRLQVDVPLQAVFESPTVAGLAARLSSCARTTLASIPVLRPRGAPIASFGQERMAFLQALEPDSSAYHMPIAVRLRGALDVEALRASLEAVVRRHEVLRTRVSLSEGAVSLHVVEASSFPFVVEDLRGVDAAVRDEQVHARIHAEVARPFSLSTDAPVRALLLRVFDDEYVASFVMHHIASDGWSVGVLLREVSQHYASLRRGESPTLVPPVVEYSDWAAWQRARAESPRATTELEFWRSELSNVEPLALPTDRPRPRHRSGRSGVVAHRLSTTAHASLRAMCEAHGVTPFMALLASLSVVLSRYSRQDELAIGTVVAGRTHRELHELVGFFVNTIVLRMDLTGDPTFGVLLERAKAGAVRAFAHDETPFERLVESLSPERDPSRHPFFDVMLSINPPQATSLQLEDVVVLPERTVPGSSKFDLSWNVTLREDCIDLEVEYAAALFDESSVARMVQHLDAIVGAASRALSEPISTLQFVGPEETAQLEQWGRNDVLFEDALFLDRFLQHVNDEPERAALHCADESLSYGALAEQSARIAAWLVADGIGMGSFVGVHIDRSADMLVAMIGVMRSGAAYLPIDPALPRERIAFMVNDARCSVVLSNRHLALDGVQCRFVSIAELQRFDDEPARIPDVEHGFDAYMIYTSGSTGNPKGVVVQHASLARLLAALGRTPGMRREDVVMAATTISFDSSVCELLLPLFVGASIVLVRAEEQSDPTALTRLQRTHAVTVWLATPTTWRMILTSDLHAPRLRAWFGGEAMPLDVVESLAPRVGEMWNLYGPTETTVCVSGSRIEAGRDFMTIGRPLPNSILRVVDAAGFPGGIGIPGELVIAGPQVARGYHARGALTAARFTPDASGATRGARQYRTGDLVRWRTNGELEFLGRLDAQVKLRGHRIELGEIESSLLALPDVDDAVVVIRDDAPGGRALVAYVVWSKADADTPDGIGTRTVDGVKARLARRLPAYCVPAFVVALESMPLTASGKLDRKQLPAVLHATLEDDEMPVGTIEEAIGAVFEEVLGRRAIPRRASFFALGGHSLLVTQVVARLRERLSIQLPLRAVFDAPTILELAIRVDNERDGRAAATTIARSRPAPSAPLTFSQAQMYRWHCTTSDPAKFNQPMLVRLRGPSSSDVIVDVLHEIVRRHEGLRTCFVGDVEHAEQHVQDPARFIVERDDVSTLPLPEAEQVLHERAEAMRTRPFELARELPIRARVTRLGPDDVAVEIVTHHIANDGWSVGVLQREFAALLDAFTRGEESPLADLEIQLADYARWQRDRWAAGGYQRAMEYWAERLRGFEPLRLPAPQQEEPEAFGSLRMSVDAADAGRLRASLAGRKTTFFAASLAAYAAVLARVTGQSDIAIAAAIANRGDVQSHGMIGFFVNTVMLRLQVEAGRAAVALLADAREESLRAMDHQEAPIERVFAALEEAHPAATRHIYGAYMNVLEASDPGEFSIGNNRLRPMHVPSRGTPQFDLSFKVFPGEALDLALIYRTAVIDHQAARAMLQALRDELLSLIDDTAHPT